ncbi:MAG: hypothetical protein PHP01_03180 [Phycisphaerae bacterium]|nr:hypothetical protein [Phycisphaerae bacterium]
MKAYQKVLIAVCFCGLILFVNTAIWAADSNSPKAACKKGKAVKTAAKVQKEWQDTFEIDKKNFVSVGENKYFVLIPGYRLNLKSGRDRLIITVLNETKVVDGVETRIVEERETSEGKLAEISRNYFAIDKTTGDVYYFGEDVDMYDKQGQITGHGGSWLSGENGNKFGLMMPAKPKKGDKYYQEIAPAVAMDRAEIVSTTGKATIPAGTYKKCVKTEDSSAIEEGLGTKIYAPGVGMIQDDEFVLIRADRPKADDVKKEVIKDKKAKS